MADRFYKLENGALEECAEGEGYRVSSVSIEQARAADAEGKFLVSFNEDEMRTRGIEQCSCEAGMGGCRQSIWLTCPDTEVQACIETLVANCDR